MGYQVMKHLPNTMAQNKALLKPIAVDECPLLGKTLAANQTLTVNKTESGACCARLMARDSQACIRRHIQIGNG